MGNNEISALRKILNREDPGYIVNAPNYWQWFAHQKNHGILPDELGECNTQLDMINTLGLDVFSRNVYCNEQDYWFGGLLEDHWNGTEYSAVKKMDGNDLVTIKRYKTKKGELTERLRYIFSESTLVQEKYLSDDTKENLDILEEILKSRSYSFLSSKYKKEQKKAGNKAIVVAGEVCSPLKMLHIFLGPVESTYLLTDDEPRALTLMALHEKNQLDAVRQMVATGVPVVMAMDNLDSQFHPPYYIEKYSASFYRKASEICHEHGASFFIHACGNQKDNLKLISDLGVDGLEGCAFPPVGDVELDEVMKLTHDRFIITGGITAIETSTLKNREEIFSFTRELFKRMKPFRNRFIYSASCNTAIDTDWETIRHFRDAWQEYAGI